MNHSMRKISKAQIFKITKDYGAYFPEFEANEAGILIRSSGHISQAIVMESLSYRAYRPLVIISISMDPESSYELSNTVLDVKNREIMARDHDNRRAEIRDMLLEQVRPHLDQPLTLEDVYSAVGPSLSKPDKQNSQFCMAAALLCSYLEKNGEAKDWAQRVVARVASLGSDLVEWQRAIVSDARKLLDRIEAA